MIFNWLEYEILFRFVVWRFWLVRSETEIVMLGKNKTYIPVVDLFRECIGMDSVHPDQFFHTSFDPFSDTMFFMFSSLCMEMIY